MADIVEPKVPKGVPARFVTKKADLSNQVEIDELFSTELGKPDVIVSMHGIMSLGSEGELANMQKHRMTEDL